MLVTNEEALAAGAVGLGWFVVTFWIIFYCIMLLVALTLFIFWIIAIVDCAQRKNEEFPNVTENSKTIWLIVLLVTIVFPLAAGVSAIIYYCIVIRKNPRGKNNNNSPVSPPSSQSTQDRIPQA